MKHVERAHAKLSPSSAHRWIECTPSASLEAKAGDKASDYAQEGTLAHEFAELKLRAFLGVLTNVAYTKELTKLKKHDLYTAGMDTYVQEYVDFVIQTYNEVKAKDEATVLHIEVKYDLSFAIPDGFGTGDAIVVGAGEIHIIDLKYGQGVAVSAFENAQLKLYALGALHFYDLVYTFDTVKVSIHQPRLHNYSTYETTPQALYTWAEEVVKPKASLAMRGEGEKKVGSWCKFCKVSALCRAMADYNLELAKADFQDPDLLTDAEVVAIYGQIETLTEWANSVKSHVLKTALAGKRWEGYKLVEGRSNRKYTDQVEAARLLFKAGYKPSDYTNTVLKGITEMEAMLGPAKFKELLTSVVVKPPGAPTLAPVTDKRPEYNNAVSDFS